MPFLLSGVFFTFLFGVLFAFYKKSAERSRQAQAQTKQNKQTAVEQHRPFKHFLFFFLWFVLGLGLLLQLIPLDMTVAERWFYFPIVGVLGMIGVGLQFAKRVLPVPKKVSVVAAIIIISLFSLRTFIRAKDWNSNVSLFAHDVREGPENPIMMDQLALALYLEGKTDAALSYAEKSVALAPDVRNLSHLGILYAEKKRYSEAIVAHTRALDLYTRHAKDTRKTADFLVSVEDEHAENSYMNLAHTYLMLKRPDKARALISQQGLRQLPTSPRLYFVLALAEYEAGSKQNALEAINKSYQLAPYHLTDTIRAKMKNGLPVDFRSFAL